MNRQGFVRSSVGDIGLGRRAAYSPNSSPQSKDFLTKKRATAMAKATALLGPDPGAEVTLAQLEAQRNSWSRPQYCQTTGFTTRNALPKGLTSYAASPNFNATALEAQPRATQHGT